MRLATDRVRLYLTTGTADCRVPPWTDVGHCIGLTIKLHTKTAMPYEVGQWGSGATGGGAALAARGHGIHGCGTGALGRSYPMAAAKEGVRKLPKPCGRFLSLADP